MRYIKLFESSNKSKLKDIDGLLIELKDNNFFVKVNIERKCYYCTASREYDI
jgi:hypothetical protein